MTSGAHQNPVTARVAKGLLTWNNLASDINGHLDVNDNVIANILVDRIDDIGTNAFHACCALLQFSHMARVFLVIKLTGPTSTSYAKGRL